MLTSEPELRAPVDLCDASGRRLNPAARGFSRAPLHRANLRGVWGRTKRWDYWAVMSPTHVVSITYADVDYIGIAALWWVELATGRGGGREVIAPLARGLTLPEMPGSAPLRYESKAITLDLLTAGDGSVVLDARWNERDGRAGEFRAEVAQPPGHESLNVVIPWSERRFQFTSKHQARPATATLRVGDERHDLADAFGVLDVGRGRWPYRTRWNWAGGAGRSTDGRTVGLQLGGKWTDGTGFTENGMIVDGHLNKLGDDLVWDYSWDDPMQPWRAQAPSGALDLTLEPVYDRHSRTNAIVLATEVHQVFGHWHGRFATDDGDEVHVDGLLGFAEESRSRW